MQKYVVLVAVLVLVLAGVGAFLFFSNQMKGAEKTVDTNDSSAQGTNSDDNGTDTEVPTDPDSSDDETTTETTALVTYDGTKFSPSSVEVLLGGKVTFKNDSNKSFWPAVDPHPIHTDLPGFDAGEAIGAGQSVSFTFNKVGEWHYHDHLNFVHRGVVIVKEQ